VYCTDLENLEKSGDFPPLKKSGENQGISEKNAKSQGMNLG